MTSHVISDPTATPVTPPARAGWDSLSAALTAEAPPIAARDDLIVAIAPGAAHGHPAVFFPARAAIEIDGDLLKIDPRTMRPDRLSDRARYAGVWGAFTHECAHAQHSRWDPPALANPAVVEAAMLLEESRIEAAQVRRRPDDRHWLRACVTEIVISDNGGATAAAQLPATDYAAARNAALILARVDGGILETTETAPAAAAIEKVLGPDTLARLQAIWRDAHTVSDHDTARMLELGQQWLDLIGPDPHAEPDPHSALSGAISEAITNIRDAVAAQPVPIDPAEAAAARHAREHRDRNRAGAVAAKVFGTPGGAPATPHRGTRAPEGSERSAARVLARALSSASQREAAVVKTTSVVPPGRMRMRGAMAREAQRAAGAIPTAEPFTRAVRKPVPVPPLRIGIGCDVSGSMSAYADPTASAAWIIAHAARLAAMPAETATVTFGERVRPITYPGVAPDRVTEFRCGGSEEAIDEAIDALDGALGLSRRENTRLLVIISDGIFYPAPRQRAQKRLNRLRATGCAVLWLAPEPRKATPLAGATLHPVGDPAATAKAIARAAVTAVRNA
ncbi:VWA domain-containing protein [Nocardia vaccinii]|uniref:VWA domain-containing protein n=1 Tax=Nocardia vaccinii TaxID=1822 RepID=UPI00083226F3|nr:VWA domain-containing protein [Nocardia vaccinii]